MAKRVTICRTADVRLLPDFSLSASRSLLRLDVLEVRDFLDKLISAALVVDLATIVLKPVAHDEPPDAKLDVVSAHLLEDLLTNLYLWRLVFYNHSWLCVASIDDRVAALLGAVQSDGYFVPDALCRIAFLPNQVVDELLANPFFGRQSHIFPPQNVKNMRFPSLCDDFQLRFWKVQFLHIDLFCNFDFVLVTPSWK